MQNCSESQSEQYRRQVLTKEIGRQHKQIIYPQHWKQGWKNGNIMKYAPSSQQEYEKMQRKVNLGRFARNTVEGQAAFNQLQIFTRNLIDELVISAKELGYDAVVGNGIDTLDPSGPKTFPIMFVLNTECITAPNWIVKPNH